VIPRVILGAKANRRIEQQFMKDEGIATILSNETKAEHRKLMSSSVKNRWLKNGLVFFLAMVLGFLALIAQTFYKPMEHYDAPLVPVIATAMNGSGGDPETFLWFAVAGLFLGFFTRMPAPIVGLGTVVIFPLIAMAEATVDPTTHKLIPFECVFYAAFGASAMLGCGITQMLHSFVSWLRHR